MYLHEDKERFLSVLESVSSASKIQADLVEKDNYVSLILKEIAASSDKAVFKGGTSLSKALKVINRFSEDIDISFSEHIGASRRKKLKYNIIAPIAGKLGIVMALVPDKFLDLGFLIGGKKLFSSMFASLSTVLVELVSSN